MELIIYTDGASRGNPGLAAYGFIIYKSDGKLLYKQGKCIGITTNNIAEYTAVLEALKYVKDNSSESDNKVTVYLDSLLVTQQLSGKYKIKNSGLKPYYEKIKSMENIFTDISYIHIPRTKNKLADRIANLALDSRK